MNQETKDTADRLAAREVTDMMAERLKEARASWLAGSDPGAAKLEGAILNLLGAITAERQVP